MTALTEFGLIRRFFQRPSGPGEAPDAGLQSHGRAGDHPQTVAHAQVPVGIGDDCAIVAPTPGMQLAVSSDMLVEGRHFLSTVDPARLGHKALAVNLSDLAACGARPLGMTLALALPQADATWLEGFAHGLFALADAHGIALIGGDTTRGPLNICITVMGEVPPGQALLRSGAQVGDEVWVSGTLGDARLALEVFRGRLHVGQHLSAEAFEWARRRMETPTPRVALGQALRGVATSAIDISDGLLGDLGHILAASGVGARIDTSIAIRLISNFSTSTGAPAPFYLMPSATHPIEPTLDGRLECVLAGGDDYELAFTAPADRHADVLAAGRASHTPVTCIGRIEAEPGVRLLGPDGALMPHRAGGFDHFATP